MRTVYIYIPKQKQKYTQLCYIVFGTGFKYWWVEVDRRIYLVLVACGQHSNIGEISTLIHVEAKNHRECVVFFPFIWTSSSLDVPAGVTKEEGHTGFLIHLPSAVRAFIFLARRIQPFLSLVDREVEFCVLTS